MISAQKRKAVYVLHQEGNSLRKISRDLNISVNSVRKIIEEHGEMPDKTRSDKIEPDSELIESLYKKCDGYVQRVQELLEEQGIIIAYSTLTRLVRNMGIGKPASERCDKRPDEPGAEMQHDTSDYYIHFGESKEKIKVIASLLYLRYSKVRYLKFYRSFNRFNMKCFFHEALSYWGYCAPLCIIDNTNLARHYGTGKRAVIASEMEMFSKNYGFKFECHELGHSNRKAGNERGFYTTETNFFPGRTFEDLDDMNQQAFDWTTEKMFNRPLTKSKIIPSVAFDHEKSFLKDLPAYVEAPYTVHERGTDQYGYISFDGNFYRVPGTSRFKVKVLQYCHTIVLYHLRQKIAEYPLPPYYVKNEVFLPPGEPKSKYQPHSRKNTTGKEEKILRNLSETVNGYLDYVLATKGKGKARHTFIRKLYTLHNRTALPLFEKSIARAMKHSIEDIRVIENIITMLMKESDTDYVNPSVEIDWEYKKRPAFEEGRYTAHTDLSRYSNEEEEEEEEENG